jgi:dipeptidyl aminopeptidase/acylaminoacyl peptidase
MKMLKVSGLFILILFIMSPAMTGAAKKDKAQPAKKKSPEFKEIISLKSPGGARISPDGRYVLYSVRETDWDKNQYVNQIWMAAVSTGELKQMTFAKASSRSFRWSPDSRSFTFLSRRGDKTQLYLMSASGGEGKQTGDLKNGMSGYEWSPDGKTIAYTAADEKSKRQKAIEKKYGGFKVIDKEAKPGHLWLLQIESGKTEKIVDRKDLHVRGISWSPDGKHIAFSGTPDSRILSFSKSDIYIVNIADKKVKHLVNQKGPDGSPTWSPDGKTIAFSSQMGAETYFVNTEICTIPVKGGPITCLTKEFDEDARLMAWKQDGIYFGALQGMSSHLYRLHPKTRRLQQITKGYRFIARGTTLSRDGKAAAFSYVNGASYPEIYYSPLKPFKPHRLTDFSGQLKGRPQSIAEEISWKSKDGAEITGVLTKPADFDANKKYPLFVIIHGGPTGISYPQRLSRYNWLYPIEGWLAKGALILEPNYRGSAGFGSDFRKLNYRNLGVGDYWDVISGVDHLIAKGLVDKDKVASMGWSQGGYISAFITTFSHRFKAVSVGAGISDWVDYYYRTDITPFCIHYLGANPWEDPEVYRKTSPMTHINNAKTPTLIQHGEFDQRVPINNAYKLYRGLQDRGVPSKFIVYKGFGHGIRKPKENLAVVTHNWRWFNKYIYGEEPEEEKFEEEKKEPPN